MPNTIKYGTEVENNTLKKGDFVIGVNDVDYGPTNETGYHNTITPPSGGYVVYKNRGDNQRSIYVAESDEELVLLKDDFGATGTTANDVLVWATQQSDVIILNNPLDNIVTDGLILYLDNGITSSYPKTDNTWYDLSGNEYDSTLVNGPTFNSENQGTLAFDGTNDYVNLSDSLSVLQGSTKASLSVWVKLYSSRNSSTKSGIIQLSGFDNWNGCLYFYTDSARVGGIWLDTFLTTRYYTGDWAPTFDATLWHNLTITTTPGSNGWKMYLNGIFRYQSTGPSTVSVNNTRGFNLGRNSVGRYLTGNIGPCLIYNKDLSSTEVLQNYNAQKSRFGL